MRFKTKYRYWTIFFIVLGVFILFGFIAYISYLFYPNEQAKREMTNMHGIATGNAIIRYGLAYFFIVTFSYFASNYYYKLLTEKKNWVSFLKISLIILLACYVYDVIIFYSFHSLVIKQYASLPAMFFSTTINMSMLGGICFIVAYITNLREGQKQRKILEAQKLQLEVEISQANLNFLKAQINPHFLHNTLNFLYAKSLPYSPELSEGILTLSDIMRYALNEGNVKDGIAPLKDEVEHVRNVIKINQLRYGHKLNVNFDVNGVLTEAKIIPFVLITLVENAFKHGDLKNTNNPIDIKLDVTSNKIIFYCSNIKKSGPKELSTGVGLENIRKRLDLAYGDKYSFKVKDDAEFYTTELTIEQL